MASVSNDFVQMLATILTFVLWSHAAGKYAQMAVIVHRHRLVSNLCYHAGICGSLYQTDVVRDTTESTHAKHNTLVLRGKKSVCSSTGRSNFAFQSVSVKKLLTKEIIDNSCGMRFPILISDSMRISLTNRSAEIGAANYITVQTLRAKQIVSVAHVTITFLSWSNVTQHQTDKHKNFYTVAAAPSFAIGWASTT